MKELQRSLDLRLIVQLLIVILLIPLLPMLISGRWNWWEAWAYAAIHILGFVVSRALAARRHPDILAERAKSMAHENAEPWDRILGPTLGLGSIFILIFAGIEARMGGADSFAPAIRAAGLVVILLGYALGTYAMMENRFFSGVVRIQRERGHKVVSGGPYRWLRHPGYLGILLSYIATPVLLGAPSGFIPVAFLLGVLFLRTHLEDRTLQQKLDGYQEYASVVRYRLLPGIW